MRPTLRQIKEKFDYYNNLCFEGKLPVPPIRLNMRYSAMGMTMAREVTSKDGTVSYTDISIEISIRRDLPEEEYDDTLVHEMIHYYIFVNNIRDTSPHGTAFLTKMNEIKAKYGIKVTVKFDPTEEFLVKTVSDRYRYICVLDFDDGRLGLSVVARGKVFAFWREMPRIPHINKVKWYASNRAIFEKFPTMVSLRYINIEADKLCHYLTGAVELERDGDTIRAKR